MTKNRAREIHHSAYKLEKNITGLAVFKLNTLVGTKRNPHYDNVDL